MADEARTLNFGVLLSGPGQVWVKGVTLDIVPSKPTGSMGGASWTLAGSNPEAYEIGEVLEYGLPASRYLRSTRDPAGGFGALAFATDASSARGKRLTLSASVKAENVADWAGLWLRVDGADGAVLAFDNMNNRPIKGTKDWQPYQIVLDVPPTAATLVFGVLVNGTGQVCLKNVEFEAVPATTPTEQGR